MKTNEKIAIIGNGWVGKNMKALFPDALVYTEKMGTKEEVNACTIAFIAVPTPLIKTDGDISGRLDTSIVEDIMKWCTCELIVVRSTVNPGDCDRWRLFYGRNICMQPEYLGETPDHVYLNTKTPPFLIIGGGLSGRERLIALYATVYNSNVHIRQVTNYAAEIIKMTENRAIAFKVMQMQELWDVCQVAKIDYYTVRDAVYGDDPRFNLNWTYIFPDKRGFNNSKCLVKDVPAWCGWVESFGYTPELTRKLITLSNDYEQGVQQKHITHLLNPDDEV